MSGKYFSVHNGLTVGPLSIDATTGDITTTGNISAGPGGLGNIIVSSDVTLTGDVTGTGAGTVNTTLADVNADVGTYGSSIQIPVISVDSKGRVTAITTANNAGGSGVGTVTSVSLVSSSAALTISGGPITTTGTLTIGLVNDLAAVEALSTTGIVRRTGTNTWTAGGAIDLGSEVTGNLPISRFNSGSSASSSTFWRGDGVWTTVPAPAIAASALTGTTLASGITASSLTSVGTLGTLDVTGVITTGASGTALEVGTKVIPQNSQSTNYTLVSSDNGKHLLHPGTDATARTFTIPANSAIPYPIGTALTFVNQNGAGVLSIGINTDTMRLAGAGTTGTRTLAANGIATAIKITSTEWIISGTGLT